MCKLEEHIIPEYSTAFYHRYLDDSSSKWNKDSLDHMLHSFNTTPTSLLAWKKTSLTSLTQRSRSRRTPFPPLPTSSLERSSPTGNIPYLSSGSVTHFGSALHLAKRLTTNWKQDLQSKRRGSSRLVTHSILFRKMSMSLRIPRSWITNTSVNWLDDRHTCSHHSCSTLQG